MIIIDYQVQRLEKNEGFRKEVDLSPRRVVSSERFSSLNTIVRLGVLFGGPKGRVLGVILGFPGVMVKILNQ